jgi:acyl-coenzyme A thioesterase PaaI-like protein
MRWPVRSSNGKATGIVKGMFRSDTAITPRPPKNELGGPHWHDLVVATARTMDMIVQVAPPDAVIAEAGLLMKQAGELLAPYQVEESSAPAGQRSDVQGRGLPVQAPVVIDEIEADALHGRVRFPAFQHGHNGAVHGGAIALFFDEAIGSFVAATSEDRVRTAYLHVDFRGITPVEHILFYEVEISESEGRKIRARASIRDGDRLCAEATVLMLTLLPGQQ